MKRFILLFMVGWLSFGCNAQNNESKTSAASKGEDTLTTQPKGSWNVNKEFDENGKLIRYDSIYSWSSGNTFENLSSLERDSVMQSFKSKFFKNFSNFENQGFEGIFSKDSLFSQRFFNEDFFDSNFGNDFMDIDQLRQQMLARQKLFLEKYQSKFTKPEDEN